MTGDSAHGNCIRDFLQIMDLKNQNAVPIEMMSGSALSAMKGTLL